jgi:hypothetical protein
MCIGGIVVRKMLLFFLLCLSCSVLRAIQFEVRIKNDRDGTKISIIFPQGQPCFYGTDPFDRSRSTLSEILIKEIQDEPNAARVTVYLLGHEGGREFFMDFTFGDLPPFAVFGDLLKFFSCHVGSDSNFALLNSDDNRGGGEIYTKIKEIAEHCYIFISIRAPTWGERFNNFANWFRHNRKYFLGLAGLGTLGYGYYHYNIKK